MSRQVITAFSFGVVFVIALIVLAVAFPAPSPFQYTVFRVVLALAAAGVGAMIPGFVHLEMKPVAKFAIRAGGALAVFLIVYFFNPAQLAVNPPSPTEADSDLSVAAIRVKDKGPGLSLLDITLRNRGTVDAIVHKAVLRIVNSKVVTLGGHPRYFPSTHQYNANVTLSDKTVPVELSQIVPAKAVDRFQLTFVLGDEEKEESPWGSADIKWFHGDDGTKVTHIETTAQLELKYDEEKYFVSKPFSFIIRSPEFGFKAGKIAGTDLKAKIDALQSPDLNVVESLVRELATIGGEEVLSALQELLASDHEALSKYYEEKIYGRTENPRYWDLPPTDQRMAEFRRTLENAVKLLKEGN